LRAKSTPIGSVLIAHGNAGCALHRGYLAIPIHDAAAVDVYVLEYPGYGARKGWPGQRPILDAADEAIELLAKRGPVYVVGESIGVGVATHLAQNHGETIGGLMLLAPYNNLVSVAQRQMPFLPAGWLLWDRFDPANDLLNYQGPVGFVLAGADTVIPQDLGRKLHDGYAGPKTLQVIPNAGHNDVADQSPEWWKSVVTFWLAHPPTQRPDIQKQ
jgi:pimeloyl-ACP methyl ester carboxylesterase